MNSHRSDIRQFESHWDNHILKEIPQVKSDIAEKFLNPIFSEILNNNRIIRILDAGCGDGVHNNFLFKTVDEHNRILYSGMDISGNALKIAKQHTEPDTRFRFIQADVSHLPVKKEAYEIVFSYGVLAYTNNPYASFCELYRCTKPGGFIGIWLFPKMKGIQGIIFSSTRSFCKIIGLRGTQFIANLIVPFLSILPTNSKISLKNASWRQCREIVMVNIAPSQLYFPKRSEILQWFARNNIKIIKEIEDLPICLWGQKC